VTKKLVVIRCSECSRGDTYIFRNGRGDLSTQETLRLRLPNGWFTTGGDKPWVGHARCLRHGELEVNEDDIQAAVERAERTGKTAKTIARPVTSPE
jgi:hypothetical protein